MVANKVKAKEVMVEKKWPPLTISTEGERRVTVGGVDTVELWSEAHVVRIWEGQRRQSRARRALVVGHKRCLENYLFFPIK